MQVINYRDVAELRTENLPDRALVATCVACGDRSPTREPDYCGRCGAPTVLPAATEIGDIEPLPGLWRYLRRLPLDRDTSWLSIGEGNTPLISATAGLSHWAGLDRLLLKLEHLNPSGSFKDRASALGISHALGHGADTVICASSGNAAGSTAAYASRAGLRTVVIVPESAPAGKLQMARAHGATALRVPGDYSRSFAVGRELAHRNGWINMTTTFVNPVAVAALKTAGYELAEQLPAVPDWILVPVGAGPLLFGVLAGYREMAAAGRIDRLPKMVAVQVTGCAPIATAFANGAEQVRAWDRIDSGVSAISDPLRGYPADGTFTLRLIRESGGCAIAVSDADAAEAQRLLSRDGLLVEPGAAVGVAAARQLVRDGVVDRSDRVVCLLTGHGAKTLAETAIDDVPLVDNADAAAAYLQT